MERGLTFKAPVWVSCLILILASGCALVPPLPKVDLKEPGWKTQEAQAVYRQKRDTPEIVGELLIATKDNERTYVQFTKNPFPVAVAQSTSHSWEVELPMQNKRYSGHGNPPKRLIFLYVPRVLAGEPPPKGWTARKLENNGVRLENDKSGESLEVYLNESSK